MKYLFVILLIISSAGCSKHEEAAPDDSLLETPMIPPPVGTSRPDSNGLFVDSFMVQQQPDIERLNGIEPVRVVAIYRDFQPLRNHSTTPVQLDSFLHKQKITQEQLHSVLAEGDRLGWGKAAQHK